MRHLFNYTSAITADMKWMVLEPADALRSGAVCDPFLLNKLTQVIQCCSFFSEIIHPMGVHRLRQNKNPSDISFSFELNSDARRLLYIVMFHDLNSLGTFIANILDVKKWNGYENATSTLRRTRIVPQYNRGLVYHALETCEKFRNENFWTFLSDAIVRPSTKFGLSYVSSPPESQFVLAKLSIRYNIRLLWPDHQISTPRLLSAFTTLADTLKIFVTPFLRCKTAALAHFKVVTSQSSFHREVPVV